MKKKTENHKKNEIFSNLIRYLRYRKSAQKNISIALKELQGVEGNIGNRQNYSIEVRLMDTLGSLYFDGDMEKIESRLHRQSELFVQQGINTFVQHKIRDKVQSLLRRQKDKGIYEDILMLISETLFLSFILGINKSVAGANAIINFYCWPGYMSLMNSGDLERTALKYGYRSGELIKNGDASHGVGFVVHLGEKGSITNIETYDVCDASNWFNWLLAKDLRLQSRVDGKLRDYYPGGTHSWMSADVPPILASENYLDNLVICCETLSDEKSNTSAKNKENAQMQSQGISDLWVLLNDKDRARWGRVIEQKLNEAEVIRTQDNRNAASEELNRLMKRHRFTGKKGKQKLLWPYHKEEEQNYLSKESFYKIQKNRVLLYTIWLNILFPKILKEKETKNRVIEEIELLFEKLYVKGFSGSVSTDPALETIKQIVNKNKKSISGNSRFKYWISSVLSRTATLEQSERSGELGTNMIFCSHKFDSWILGQAKNWLEIVFRDIRFAETSPFLVNSQRATDAQKHTHMIKGFIAPVERAVEAYLEQTEDEGAEAAMRQLRYSVGLFSTQKYYMVKDEKFTHIKLDKCIRLASQLAIERLVDRINRNEKEIDEKFKKSPWREHHDDVCFVLDRFITGSDGWRNETLEFLNDLIFNLKEKSKEFKDIPNLASESAIEGLIIYAATQAIFHASVFLASLYVEELRGLKELRKYYTDLKLGGINPIFDFDVNYERKEIVVTNRAFDKNLVIERANDYKEMQKISSKFPEVKGKPFADFHWVIDEDKLGAYSRLTLKFQSFTYLGSA